MRLFALLCSVFNHSSPRLPLPIPLLVAALLSSCFLGDTSWSLGGCFPSRLEAGIRGILSPVYHIEHAMRRVTLVAKTVNEITICLSPTFARYLLHWRPALHLISLLF